MRWTQPLHAPTLLIHENSRLCTHCIAESANEIRYLIWSAHVPFEDDQTPRAGITQKGPLTGGNGKSLQSRDKCAWGHWPPISPRRQRGSSFYLLIPLDEALPASGL